MILRKVRILNHPTSCCESALEHDFNTESVNNSILPSWILKDVLFGISLYLLACGLLFWLKIYCIVFDPIEIFAWACITCPIYHVRRNVANGLVLKFILCFLLPTSFPFRPLYDVIFERNKIDYFFPRGHGNESCNLIGSVTVTAGNRAGEIVVLV